MESGSGREESLPNAEVARALDLLGTLAPELAKGPATSPEIRWIGLGAPDGVVSRGRGLLRCAGEGEEHAWSRDDERRLGEELDGVISQLEGDEIAVVGVPAWALDEAPGCGLARRALACHGNLHAVVELPGDSGKPGAQALVLLSRERRGDRASRRIYFLRPFAAHDPRQGGDPIAALGWHGWWVSAEEIRDQERWRPDLPPRLAALEVLENLARSRDSERVTVGQARSWIGSSPPRVDEDYLEALVRQPPIREAVRLGWNVEDLPIPLPLMERQHELAVSLEAAEAPADQLRAVLEGKDWRDGEARPWAGTVGRLKGSIQRVRESAAEAVPKFVDAMLRWAGFEDEDGAPGGDISTNRVTKGATIAYDGIALLAEAEQDARHASTVEQRVARLTAAADEIQTVTRGGAIVKTLGQQLRANLLQKRNQALGPVELVFSTRNVLNLSTSGRVLLNLRNRGRADVYHVALRWAVDGPAEAGDVQQTIHVIPPGKSRVLVIDLPAGAAREIQLNLRWSARNLLGAEVKGKASLSIDVPEVDDSVEIEELFDRLFRERDWQALEREIQQGNRSPFDQNIALALLNARKGDRVEAERALFEAARHARDADALESVAFNAQLLALPETGLAVLEDAWERYPDEGDVALALGRARHWAGQDQRVGAPLARAIEEVTSEALAVLALVADDPGDARLLLEKADRSELFNLMLIPWHQRRRDSTAVEQALRELRRARQISAREVTATVFDLLTDREAELAGHLIESYAWDSEEVALRIMLEAHVAHHRGDTTRRDALLADFFGPDHGFRIDAARPTPPNLPNPYNISKPITEDDAFFGRVDELARLRRTVADPMTMGVALLEGARRTGKTSLLNKLSRALPDDILRVQINLQEMGTPSVTRLWTWMGRQLTRAGAPPGERAVHAPTDGYERFSDLVDALLASGRWRGIALLIDEFECLDEALRSKEIPHEVLGQLRALLQNRPVGAVIAGAHALTERRLDYWSPLFGFATRVDLGPLDELSAADLVERPGADCFPWSREAVSYTLQLTGRHPFFLRHLCAQVFEARRLRWRRRPVTRTEVDEAVPATLHAAEEHLREQYLSAPEGDGQRVLRRLAAEPVLDPGGVDRDELRGLASDEALQSLDRRGYLVAGAHTGTLRVAVGLLHQWIALNHPWAGEVRT